MNGWLIAAAALLFVVGAVHSVFGEILIFRRMRTAARLIPTNGGGVLREPHVRILWATWHLVTILGLPIAAALVWLALPGKAALLPAAAPLAIIAAMLAGSLLVFVGTRGKHLGWAGLLGVAVLIGIGTVA